MRTSKTKRFRELIAASPVMLPGVPNAAMARQAERVGFEAVYVSGAGLANATAGVAARRDPGFMIIARTDARAVEDFDRTVNRAQRYIEAGADAIFPEALQSEEEFRDFASEIDVPLLANMTEFGKSPLLSFQDLAKFGYRMVIFPQSAFRVSMKASEKFLQALKVSGTQKEWMNEMQTREELYKLLDYDPTAEKWLGLSD